MAAAVDLFLWLNRLIPRKALKRYSSSPNLPVGSLDGDVLMSMNTTSNTNLFNSSGYYTGYYRDAYPELSRYLSLEIITQFGIAEQRKLLAMPVVVVLLGKPTSNGQNPKQLCYVLQATRHKYHVCDYNFVTDSVTIRNMITNVADLRNLLKLYQMSDCCIVAPLLVYPPDRRYFLIPSIDIQIMNLLLLQMNQELLGTEDLPILLEDDNDKFFSKRQLQRLGNCFGPTSLPTVNFPQVPGLYLPEECSRGEFLMLALPTVKSTTTGKYRIQIMSVFSILGFRSKSVSQVLDQLSGQVSQPHLYKQLNRFSDSLFTPEANAMSEVICWILALLHDNSETIAKLGSRLTDKYMQPTHVARYNMESVARNVRQYCDLDPNQISREAVRRLECVVNALNTLDIGPDNFLYEWLDATLMLTHIVRPMTICNKLVMTILLTMMLGGNSVAKGNVEWRLNSCCLEVIVTEGKTGNSNFANSHSTGQFKRHIMLSMRNGPAMPRIQDSCSECLFEQTQVVSSAKDFSIFSGTFGLVDNDLSTYLARKTNRLCSLLCTFADCYSNRLTLGMIYTFIVNYLLHMGCSEQSILHRNIMEMLTNNLLPPFFALHVLRSLLGTYVSFHPNCPTNCVEYLFLSFCLDLEPQHSILIYTPVTCNYQVLQFNIDYKNYFIIQDKNFLINYVYREFNCTMEDLSSGEKKIVKAQELDNVFRNASCFFYRDY